MKTNPPELYPDYYPPIIGGPAEPADEEDLKKDELGYTNPYLHRRFNVTEAGREIEGELQDREYHLAINSTDSYRTTAWFLHDEDNFTEDKPP